MDKSVKILMVLLMVSVASFAQIQQHGMLFGDAGVTGIQLHTYTINDSSYSTTMMVEAPTGIENGDLIVFVLGYWGNRSIVGLTSSTGFTVNVETYNATADCGFCLLYKYATSNEPSVYILNTGYSSYHPTRAYAYAMCIKNAAKSKPIRENSITYFNTSATATINSYNGEIVTGDLVISAYVQEFTSSAGTLSSIWENDISGTVSSVQANRACGYFLSDFTGTISSGSFAAFPSAYTGASIGFSVTPNN